MPHTELTVSALRTPASPTRVIALVPGLGTAATGTWDEAAEYLHSDSYVLAVDLPGHGLSPAWNTDRTQPDMAALAEAVVAAFEQALEHAGLTHLPLHLAGISLGGGLALQAALNHSDQFASIAVICSAAKVGQPEAWSERAGSVRADGPAHLVEGSVSRWFAPDFPTSHPERVEALTSALSHADAESYALLCQTLGTFDVSDRLAEIALPVLVIAGEQDTVTPPHQADLIAVSVPVSRLHVINDVAHQAPTEKPQDVAGLLNDFFAQD